MGWMPTGGGGGVVVPEWVQYLAERQSDETPHADDDFFDGNGLDGAWTTLTVSGTQTITVARGRLGIRPTSTITTSDFNAILKNPASIPIGTIIETVCTPFVDDTTDDGYMIAGLVFSDGATATDDLAAWHLQMDRISRPGGVELRGRNGTFTSFGASTGYNKGLQGTNGPWALRLVYSAVNTFQQWIDDGSGGWYQIGSITKAITPTWYGLVWSTSGANPVDRVMHSSYEYFRVN